MVMCEKYNHALQNTVIVACDTTNNFSLAWHVISNVVETLDKIENRFLSNPHNVSLLVDTLTELYNLIENTNDDINRGLLNTLKKAVLK